MTKEMIINEIEELEKKIAENMLIPNWTDVNELYDLMMNNEIIKLERMLRDNF